MWRFVLISISLASCMLCQDFDATRLLIESQRFTPEQAAAAEAAVQTNPDDWQAHVKLLGFYTSQARIEGATESTQMGRVQQVLWLIEHRPELNLLRFPDAAIPFQSGNVMVMNGVEEATQAWRQALATHSSDVRVLGNAAWFFRLKDREQAVDLLRRAVAADPRNRMLADQLGTEYGLILLGVRGFDASGRANRFDPVEANSPLAQTIRAELKQSSQAAVLYATGSTLMDYRSDVMKSGNAEDPNPFAANLIERAKALDPNMAPARIRVGGNVQASNLVTQVQPVYPALAKQARIQGVVRFSVVIGRDGSISNVQLVSGHPLLVAAAQEAVKQWTYKPTLLNGAPVEVVTQIDIVFSLTPPKPAAESDILNK